MQTRRDSKSESFQPSKAPPTLQLHLNQKVPFVPFTKKSRKVEKWETTTKSWKNCHTPRWWIWLHVTAFNVHSTFCLPFAMIEKSVQDVQANQTQAETPPQIYGHFCFAEIVFLSLLTFHCWIFGFTGIASANVFQWLRKSSRIMFVRYCFQNISAGRKRRKMNPRGKD